jgi:hypothetical protein
MSEGISEVETHDVHAALEAIRRILEGDSDRKLSPEEVLGLKNIVEFEPEIVEAMRLRRANRLLISYYRGIVIGAAAFVAASFLLWDKVVSVIGITK